MRAFNTFTRPALMSAVAVSARFASHEVKTFDSGEALLADYAPDWAGYAVLDGDAARPAVRMVSAEFRIQRQRRMAHKTAIQHRGLPVRHRLALIDRVCDHLQKSGGAGIGSDER